MNALNKLGTALAISSLTLAIFGCKDQSSSTSQAATPASIDSSSNISELTPINTLTIADYSLDLCIKNTGREYIEEINALICNNKGIQFLEGIEQLTELKTLHLNFNQIQDINPLNELKKLKTLYLSSNQVSSLEPLSTLTMLEELAIQKNDVQDLSPLTSLNALKTLHARSNNIYDFSMLNELHLEILSGDNQQG